MPQRSSQLQVHSASLLRLVLLSCACLCATTASAQVVGNEADLRQAIIDANATGAPATITLSGNITLTGTLPLIQEDIAFVGGGFTIDAANTHRVFTIGEGNVTIANLTIANARALGGAGGAGSFPGGGSAGMGAAIFLNSGASLTSTNLIIQNAAAQGGAGGAVTAGGGGGGGGGFTGAGGASVGPGGGGGGGFAGVGGLGGAGGGGGGGGGALGVWTGDPIGATGGAGAVGGGGGGGRSFAGGAGADGGGEGGGASAAGAPAVATTGGAGLSAEGGDGGNTGVAGQDSDDNGGGGGGGAGAAGGTGARRGAGGGGGAGASGGHAGTQSGGGGAGSGALTVGGKGADLAGGGGGGAIGGEPGFGAGAGGGAIAGGNAVFGGGGAGFTTAGTSIIGGNGSSGPGAGGGGGGAFGGAIFVEEGATLTMIDPSFTGTFTVTGGAGSGTAGSGQQSGRLIFTQGGGGGVPVTFDISTNRTITGTDAFAGGGPRRKAGPGTLTVDSSNPASGGPFTVAAGVLDGGSDTAFGDGAIVGDGGTLQGSGGPRNYANPITLLAGGLRVGGAQNITLSGVVTGTGVLSAGMAPASTLTLTGTNLHTTGGTAALSGLLTVASDLNLGAATAPLTLDGGTFRPLAATTFARPLVLAPGGGLFDTNGFATAWSGPVIGSTLNKAGAGVLTLSNANTFVTANIMAGALAVTGGAALSDSGAVAVAAGAVLNVGASETIGALSGAGNVQLPGSTLTVNAVSDGTFSGVISGTGGLAKTGAGVLTLTGVNTYQGTTALGGFLAVASDANLGAAGGALTLNGGALRPLAATTFARPLVLAPGSGSLDTNGFAIAWSGPVTGSTLSKIGTGVLTLTNANTFAGANVVSGALAVASDANLGAAGAPLTLNGGTFRPLAATTFARPLVLAAGGGLFDTNGFATAWSGPVTGSTLNKIGAGVLTLSNANTFAAANITAGALAVTGGAALSDSGVVAVAAGAVLNVGASETIGALSGAGNVQLPGSTLTVNAASDGTFSGVISGTGGLAKTGAGVLTLTGVNTYQGTTALGGLLAVASDANLGAAGGALTLNGGTFRPLAATTFARSLVLAPGGGFFDTNGFATAWSGPVTGSTLNKIGAGVLTLSNANTFAAANITAGTLAVTGGAALSDNGTVVVAAGAVLNVGASETIGTLSGAGNVQLTGSTLTVTSGSNGTLSGIISGTGGLVKTGTGALTLAGVNTYQGPTSLTGGTLHVTSIGTIPGTTTVSAGILTGDGSTGAVNLTGGVIEPLSILAVNGNLNIGASAALTTDIDDPTPGTGFGQLRVNGTVTLAGALNTTFGTVPGTSYVLIENDGTDPISGTFAGLAEGASIDANGAGMRITYVGGTGNDVVLIPDLFITYLAEGATNSFFDVRIALVNPSPIDTANVTLRFLTSVRSVVTSTLTIPPLSRRTLNPKTIALLAAADFSTVIESNARVVVDRTMTWDASGYGSHAETSSGAPATIWYFAEGATHGFFDLFYLLQNATTTPASVEITYLRPAPLAPIVKTYTVGANSRKTIPVDQEDAGLAAADVSAVIRVTNGVPISTERAMYLSTPGQAFAAGSAVSGIAAPSPSWFFAEGATGPFFDFFLLLANPQNSDAAVTIVYATSTGSTVTRQYTVAANSRRTISVEQEDPLLQNAAIAATVTVTNAVPILAERSIFWPAYPWYEGHASAGVTATGTQWALAEGEAGGAADTQTYILIANTGTAAATVRVTLLLEGGGTLQRDYTIAANSRFNVNAGVDFPQAMNKRFGAIVQSLGATPQPLVVERSMYTNAGGVTWTAGTNAVATRLQ